MATRKPNIEFKPQQPTSDTISLYELQYNEAPTDFTQQNKVTLIRSPTFTNPDNIGTPLNSTTLNTLTAGITSTSSDNLIAGIDRCACRYLLDSANKDYGDFQSPLRGPLDETDPTKYNLGLTQNDALTQATTQNKLLTQSDALTTPTPTDNKVLTQKDALTPPNTNNKLITQNEIKKVTSLASSISHDGNQGANITITDENNDKYNLTLRRTGSNLYDFFWVDTTNMKIFATKHNNIIKCSISNLTGQGEKNGKGEGIHTFEITNPPENFIWLNIENINLTAFSSWQSGESSYATGYVVGPCLVSKTQTSCQWIFQEYQHNGSNYDYSSIYLTFEIICKD